MDLIQIVLITIQTAMVFSRRHDSSSADESIENLLYYRDCQKPKTTEAPTPMPLRAPLKPNPYECRYPKMCCSLSCNNECDSSGKISLDGRTMGEIHESPMIPRTNPFLEPAQPNLPIPSFQGKRGRRKRIKPLLPPIGGRREFGFTKERIKSLISKDDDIRKILKDLVRVTMQKVDLVEMINSRRAAITPVTKKPEITNISNDEDDDLE